MRTSNRVLLLLGLLVVGLTAAALAYMESQDDRAAYTFVTSEAPLGESSADGVGEGGARLNWTLPANATEAVIGLLVTFTGQAFTGGSATVQVQVVGPDGVGGPVQRIAFPIGQGATSGEVNATLGLRWLEVPQNTTADPDGFDRSVAWTEPLSLLVVVQPPGDLPAASYDFSARASATALVYAAQEA